MKALFLFFSFFFALFLRADQETYGRLVHLLAQQKIYGSLSPDFYSQLAHYDFDYQEPTDGYTLLMVATTEGHNDVVKHLLKLGADPNQAMQWGNTALHEAIEKGNLEGARLLIKGHARLDARTKDGHSPFCLGVIYNQKDLIAALKEEFPEVDSYIRRHAMRLRSLAECYNHNFNFLH